jgi:membrane protein DedA with SNARE-associated domain
MFVTRVMGFIGTLAVETISSLGYLGVFCLMVLESMVVPIPSELVMPFAGFLASQGRFSMAGVIIVSTLGSIAGSLISYYIGMFGGREIVERWGRYLLVSRKDLDKTHSWFANRGESTIFVARLIPVVRHLISIPAGVARMNLGKFILFTVLGAGIWNSFLAYLGYALGENWESVRRYTEPLSIVMAVAIVALGVWFVWRHFKRHS